VPRRNKVAVQRHRQRVAAAGAPACTQYRSVTESVGLAFSDTIAAFTCSYRRW
jgi:hypothetical protein